MPESGSGPAARATLRLGAGLILVSAAGLLLTAQEQVPTFRSSVTVIRLDVSVLDPKRRPIRGLRKDDFTVLVDGVVQPLVGVSEIEYPVTPPEGAERRPRAPTEFVSNEAPANRRAFNLVLDDALARKLFMVDFGKRAARAFVEGLQPDDLVAVTFSWVGTHNQEFTTDRDRILAAIDSFELGPTDFPQMSALARIASSKTLRNAITRLREAPSLRGAIVLISPGTASSRESQPPPGGIRTVSEEEVIYGTELRSAVGEAAYARLPIYAISNTGLTAPGPGPRPWAPVLRANSGNDSLTSVANGSGGFAVVNTNDPAPGVKRILLENSSHYVIGYQPTYPVQDGRSRRLEIRVRRSDAKVSPSGRYFRTPRPATREQVASPRAAIAGIVPMSDVPLAVRTTVGEVDAARGQADVAIDLRIGPVEKAAGRAEIECVAFDAAHHDEMGSVAAAPPLPDEEGVTTARLVLALEPGRYTLRCGLYAPALRRLASVYTDLTVPDARR